MANDADPFFHVFVGHLHLFFGEMSSQMFCPFLNAVIYLLIQQ